MGARHSVTRGEVTVVVHTFQLKGFVIQLAGYLKLGVNRAFKGLVEESARRLEIPFNPIQKAKQNKSAADGDL
jgi:hypothetical protein